MWVKLRKDELEKIKLSSRKRLERMRFKHDQAIAHEWTKNILIAGSFFTLGLMIGKLL